MTLTKEEYAAFDAWWEGAQPQGWENPYIYRSHVERAFQVGVEHERARWEKKLDAIEIKSDSAKNKVAYGENVNTMYIDVSPTERIYFESLVIDEWSTAKEDEAAAANRRAEIKAALKKLLETL